MNVVRTGPGRSDDDFTEIGFRGLLRSLKAGGYRFARFDGQADGRHVLWRHDVDFSMHRAAVLAEIEAEEGATATYFVNPRCLYYNLAEAEVARKARRIRDLGHVVGLHFDAAAYERREWTLAELASALNTERALLLAMTGVAADCVSWHNPDRSNLLTITECNVAGLFNAYADRFREGYTYCSDSNGYWRFAPMDEIIAAGHPRLHLLTHPEWWTPRPMSSARRLARAIVGRARANRAAHEAVVRRPT